MATSIAKILELGKDADKFHPLAVKNYQEFIGDILKDVPLDAISEDDAKKFLSESEYEDYQHSQNSLREWLTKCLLTANESTLYVYPNSFPTWGTSGFKSLLLKVAQKKALQIKQQEAIAKAELQARLLRHQETQERERAIAEHQQWLDRANISKETFKAKLNKNFMPRFQTPFWLIPYSPSNWVKQLSKPTKDWFTSNENIPIAANKSVLEKALQNALDVEYFYQDYYLPMVQYEVVNPPPVSVKGHLLKTKPGIPCLKWLLATYIISIAKFQLPGRPIVDKRNGYDFEVVCTPEKLGTVYSGPEFWQYQPPFITPIRLLAMLVWGKAEMIGVEVIKRASPWTEYRVEGFVDVISLHDDFLRFIRDMTKKLSLDKALLDRKMCDKETSGLIKVNLEKIHELDASAAVSQINQGQEKKTGDDYIDLVSALKALSYKESEVAKVAKQVCGQIPTDTLENKLKMALHYLGQ